MSPQVLLIQALIPSLEAPGPAPAPEAAHQNSGCQPMVFAPLHIRC